MGQRILRDTEATIQGPVARVKQLGVISRAGAGRVIVFVMIKEICPLDGVPNGPRGLTVRSTWSQGRSFYRTELTIKQRVLNTGTFTCGGRSLVKLFLFLSRH